MDSIDLGRIQLFLFLLLMVGADPDIHWTYQGSSGQSRWPELFPDCGGVAQSPINVETSSVQHDPSLVPVQPILYHQSGSIPFTLSNNGHTVVMSLPTWMALEGLPWRFTAVQLHLHWGSAWDSSRAQTGGSEHTIDGQHWAAELHVVHYNSDLYPNVSTAKSQRDGLAVLGVLIETGNEANSAFGNILNYLGRIRHAGKQVAIPPFSVRSLLPNDLGRYFRYNGSLTSPPCYESVLWTVFTERVKVSHVQLRKLETVLFSNRADDPDPVPLQNNYRKPQPLHRRVVLASFLPDIVAMYSLGEVCAMVAGSLCGFIGLAVIIHFVLKTVRSTSSWDVLPSVRPTSSPRCKETDKEARDDVDFKTTSDAEKEVSSPPTEP